MQYVWDVIWLGVAIIFGCDTIFSDCDFCKGSDLCGFTLCLVEMDFVDWVRYYLVLWRDFG